MSAVVKVNVQEAKAVLDKVFSKLTKSQLRRIARHLLIDTPVCGEDFQCKGAYCPATLATIENPKFGNGDQVPVTASRLYGKLLEYTTNGNFPMDFQDALDELNSQQIKACLKAAVKKYLFGR